MADQIRLTQFSHGGGCGCKIAPAKLQEILKGIKDSNGGLLLAAAFTEQQQLRVLATAHVRSCCALPTRQTSASCSAVYPNLLVGAETSDDAAVYKINDTQAMVVTTDFFMPIGRAGRPSAGLYCPAHLPILVHRAM